MSGVAGLYFEGGACECGINATQLSAWIRRHERGSAKTAATPIATAAQVLQPAFVPVAVEASMHEAAVTLDLQARLPMGSWSIFAAVTCSRCVT